MSVCPTAAAKNGLLQCPHLPSWQPHNKQGGNQSLFVSLLMFQAGGETQKRALFRHFPAAWVGWCEFGKLALIAQPCLPSGVLQRAGGCRAASRT